LYPSVTLAAEATVAVVKGGGGALAPVSSPRLRRQRVCISLLSASEASRMYSSPSERKGAVSHWARHFLVEDGLGAKMLCFLKCVYFSLPIDDKAESNTLDAPGTQPGMPVCCERAGDT